MKLFPIITWFVCFLAGIPALFMGGLIIVSTLFGFTELQGDTASPEAVTFLLQGCITFCLGAVCWGIAALIEMRSPS